MKNRSLLLTFLLILLCLPFTYGWAQIDIDQERVCNVPATGQALVTVSISGGVPPYQISGNFSGTVGENEAFSFVLNETATGYDILVIDSAGEEADVEVRGLTPCSKESITITHQRICHEPAIGQATVNVVITGGTAPYQVSGDFAGTVSEDESFSFVLDETATGYIIFVVDADGGEENVVVTGLTPCTKERELEIMHERTCNEPTTGQATVSVVITGGAAPYQVSGDFSGTVGEGITFSFVLDETATGYDIFVVDSEGNESQIQVRGLTPCSKANIVIDHIRICDDPAIGQSTVTVTITGGTAPYEVIGNFMGTVAEGESFSFVLNEAETSYTIIVTDASGLQNSIQITGLTPCSKENIQIATDRMCNEPNLGQSTITVIITGGTGPYDVDIPGFFNGVVEEGISFTFVLSDDETGFSIFVTDSEGLQASTIVEDLESCIKAPIELLSFEGEAMPTGNQLKWATATEENNDYFTLLYSTDGVHFTEIAQIDGQGTTDEVQTYDFMHKGTAAGNNYYKLLETDFGGLTNRVAVIVVKRGEASIGITQIYPIPAHDFIYVNYQIDGTHSAISHLRIYDILGKMVKQQEITNEKANNSIRFDIGHLGSGIYFVSLQNGSFSHTQKLLKK